MFGRKYLRILTFVINKLLFLDIDECANGRNHHQGHRCDLNADCQNTFGSYQCSCHDGYEGDGFFCEPLPDDITSKQ